jgi:hypothetical protein
MITQSDIESVYRQDLRQPYYSIQGGRSIEHKSRLEIRREWIWGHFAEALDKALSKSNINKIKHSCQNKQVRGLKA